MTAGIGGLVGQVMPVDPGVPATSPTGLSTRSPGIELADPAALTLPAPDQHAAFSEALSHHVQEVRSIDRTDASIISRDLAGRVDSLSADLTSWQQDGGVAAGSPSAVAGGSTDIASVSGQMKGAYGFAIEATLLSHGSTESTKIFNTLLKGQ